MHELILICGSNGAGKSTLVYSTLDRERHIIYVDPDRIAKEESCSPIQAGKLALSRTKEFLEKKVSFLKESTLSSRSDLKLIQTAKDQGFIVNLTYVGLKTQEHAIERVARRFKNGGHFVPEEDIRRRYDRSLNNLAEAIKLADMVKVLDNTNNNYSVVATFKHGQLQEHYFTPTWFKDIEKRLHSMVQKDSITSYLTSIQSQTKQNLDPSKK